MNIPLFSKLEIQEEGSDEVVSNEKGLSELVRVCLGKPLNKSEQTSNWEKRPLRKSQLQYAGRYFNLKKNSEIDDFNIHSLL